MSSWIGPWGAATVLRRAAQGTTPTHGCTCTGEAGGGTPVDSRQQGVHRELPWTMVHPRGMDRSTSSHQTVRVVGEGSSPAAMEWCGGWG
jgi:hypothetical protein